MLSNIYKSKGSFLIIVIPILVTVVLFRFIRFPYLWISLTWLVFSIFFIVTCKRIWVKRLWLIIAAIFFMIGALEIYAGTILHNIDHSKLRGDELNSYSEYNDLLGYVPKKNIVKPVESYYGDELLYSVTYSINDNGVRVSPQFQENIIQNQKVCGFLWRFFNIWARSGR